MLARMLSKPGTHTPEELEQRASETGLDMGAFKSCMESGMHTEAIRRAAAEAAELGASGTPAFFFGLRDRSTDQVRIFQAVTGAQPIDAFKRAIEAVAKRQQ